VPKITKRVVDAAEVRAKDYVVWDDELPGFGLRVFASGKRSYVIQYRSAGRSRRYTIGLHGVWTPETARRKQRSSSAEWHKVSTPPKNAARPQCHHRQRTLHPLSERFEGRPHPGKGGRPKKPSTIVTDTGRIERHIIPLIGTRRVKDLTKADINKVLKDIMAGKTRVSVKTKKLRGKPLFAAAPVPQHAPSVSSVYSHLCRRGWHH